MEDIMGVALRLCILVMTLASFLLGGCCKPLLPYSLETPPLTLTPASLAGMEDERGRFRQIYCTVQKDHGAKLHYDRPCEEVILRLEGEPNPTSKTVSLGQAKLKLRFLIVPGLYNDCIEASKAFSFARAHVERYGYRTADVRVSGWSSSTHNATMIRDAIRAAALSPDEKVVLIGYSKGAPDILQALVEHPEIVPKVAAVVSIAGAVGGSPLTDSIDDPHRKMMGHNLFVKCPPGVGDPIVSLQRSTRQKWLSQNRLPGSVKYFSLAAFAERENISTVLQASYDSLAQLDPRNDSQLIFYDQLIPGCTLLGYVRADHWAVAIPFSQDKFQPALIDKNEFPREVLLEAVIRFVEERLLASN
jgi:pimeloyl-ACP methyl ester carboxylesterase